jgi:ketosteroid isomerase-like protein
MEEHPNAVVARRLWNAIARGDAPALRELMSEKTVWRMPGESLVAGTYVGADAVLDFMARVGELTDDLHSDLIDIFTSDRGAVLRYVIHAARGTRRLDTEHLFAIRVVEGQITEAVFAPVDQQRYDRFFRLP